MQLGQSLPYSDEKDGATSAMMPPTVICWTVLQDKHTTDEIFCPKNPRPV